MDERNLADKFRRRSSTRVSFEAILGEICGRLESEGGEDALELAKTGRELEATIHGWSTTPPDDEERTQTIHAVTTFNQRALEVLRQP